MGRAATRRDLNDSAYTWMCHFHTKIDWDAYMSQVSGFLGGERDYSKLKGDTGPLVYPAGFLYIYSAIQYVTGGEVYPAQILFGILYIVNLGMVLLIYLKTDVLPWWALCLLSLSKRLHSIFVLRLFNDCFATTLFHAALVSFLYQKWHLGLIIFSGAVSVKMNVLLFAPPLLLLLLKGMDVFGVVSAGAGAAIVQCSTVFSRSVNFKFVPEPVFISKGFALSLLAVHLLLLGVFAHYKWCRHEGGLFSFLHSKLAQMKLKFCISSSFPLRGLEEHNINTRVLKTEHIATTMFVGNFVGVVCARSLHYQFYSCFSVPFDNSNAIPCSLILFVAVELCWNIFPSNVYSSTLLLGAHLVTLGDVLFVENMPSSRSSVYEHGMMIEDEKEIIDCESKGIKMLNMDKVPTQGEDQVHAHRRKERCREKRDVL
ncbi:hypothetical protein SASPL_120029 [Salvia splendens]|uniref:dolichyl-P-Man:Man5GlcNAc2-PP-dolichol alpha-1,3-mannosyltransferase n=1 Tax=Salvia splendens TaxID=180675 RepID=A0A8X8XPR5_SALSN|nr:hypothetical protein SASPL_120029 [Salvia splendens]